LSQSAATVSPRHDPAKPSSSAQAASRARACRGCGCDLAHGHASSWCSPCTATRRTYNPCHDPQFGSVLLELLVAHEGEPVHVHRELGIEHCGAVAWYCVKAHVRRFKRHGYVIVGSHAGTYELRSGPASRAG